MDQVEILVVDDDPKMVDGLTEILVDEGYKVTPTLNPVSAISKIKKQRFSIALVDLIMPGKNGIELLKEIMEVRSDIKVIIITGFATIESAVEAIKLGATNYVTKPFKINEIQNVIGRTLEEIKFEKRAPHIFKSKEPDRIIRAISNKTRRDVIFLFAAKQKLRFTDIRNSLEIDDPTRLSFHLRELKSSGLLIQDRSKYYSLSSSGTKTAKILKELDTVY
jgi:DNA-binding NtrC family response regulator